MLYVLYTYLYISDIVQLSHTNLSRNIKHIPEVKNAEERNTSILCPLFWMKRGTCVWHPASEPTSVSLSDMPLKKRRTEIKKSS